MATPKYRPEIDGLRAVAVLPVLLFHLLPEVLPGGFVGVDVFFVISGFLMTEVILSQHEAGTFRYLGFYQRRIARLLPAFVAMAFVTMVAAYFIYSKQDFASGGAVVGFAAVGFANLKFMAQGNYFRMSHDAQPFLHCWSLSIEEQFYLVYPFLIAACRNSRKLLLWVLSSLFVFSFVGCIWMTIYNPMIAFYSLPTRAWEMLAGGLLVLAMRSVAPSAGWQRFLVPTGLLLIALSYAIVPMLGTFPGAAPLLPISGTLLVLGAPMAAANWGTALLTTRPMILIGQVSYSLYLWHWPIFSLVDYQMFQSPLLLRVLIKLSLTVLATVVTYVWIESPARSLLRQTPRRNAAFGLFLTSAALFLIGGYVIRTTNYVNANLADVQAGGLTFGRADAPRSDLLFGDSNGAMYGKVLADATRDANFRLIAAGVAAGDPLPKKSKKNDALWKASLQLIQEQQPDIVIMACAWSAKLKNDQNRVVEAIDAIRPYCKQVIILTQPPIVPVAHLRESIRDGSKPPHLEKEENRSLRMKTTEFLHTLEQENVHVVDVHPLFDGASGDIQVVGDEGRHLFHDSTHLSSTGAELVMKQILLPELKKLGVEEKPR